MASAPSSSAEGRARLIDGRAIAAEITAHVAVEAARVLARAVLWHAERRVLVNGHRTVVFR